MDSVLSAFWVHLISNTCTWQKIILDFFWWTKNVVQAFFDFKSSSCTIKKEDVLLTVAGRGPPLRNASARLWDVEGLREEGIKVKGQGDSMSAA